MSKRNFSRGLLLASFFVSTAIVYAQPSFTYSSFAPQLNDQLLVARCQVIIPTNTGANQTWNMSNATQMSNVTYTVNPVSAIPCGSQYPTATMGLGNGSYSMLEINAGEYNCVGNTITPGMAHFVYSNPEKQFGFPMNFNYSFSDTYSGVSNSGPFPVYQTGADTVTYDGYGTLITPFGTYNNAIRILRQVTYTDSTQQGMVTCSGDYIYWFAPGYRYPIVTTWFVPCSPGGFGSGTEILQSITIGVNELQPMATFSVFPNPATTSFTITMSNEFIGLPIEMHDVYGRMVWSAIVTSNEMKIQCEGLESGVYFVSCGGRSYRMVKESGR